MARVFGLILALLYVSSSVSAVPIESRQIGGVACNVARLKTVAGLRQTTTAVNKLASSNDPAAADAATTAQGALQDASNGIKTIAGALLTGQQAPAAARDQVAQGLLTAQGALSNITSTDSTVTSMVQDAQNKLEKTISAGQDVVSQCGGGGSSAGADNTGTGSASNSTSTDTSGAASTGNNSNSTSTGVDNSTGSTADNSSSSSSVADSSSGGTSADSTNTGDSTTDNSTNGASSNAGSNAGGLSALAGLRNSRLFGKRQIGGVACNIARFQTVGRLAQSSAAVNAVKTAASGDAAVTSAATQAGNSLNSAKGAIGKIAAAIITGQQAPAAERDAVGKGLNDAMTALSSVNSTDPNVTSAISAAQDKISSTLQAGQGVVSNC